MARELSQIDRHIGSESTAVILRGKMADTVATSGNRTQLWRTLGKVDTVAGREWSEDISHALTNQTSRRGVAFWNLWNRNRLIGDLRAVKSEFERTDVLAAS